VPKSQNAIEQPIQWNVNSNHLPSTKSILSVILLVLGVTIDEDQFQYLYRQGPMIILMNIKTFEQVEIDQDLFMGGKDVVAFLSGESVFIDYISL
jgi:hypothetical protein